MVQLLASISGVVLGGVFEVMDSNLAGGKLSAQLISLCITQTVIMVNLNSLLRPWTIISIALDIHISIWFKQIRLISS